MTIKKKLLCALGAVVILTVTVSSVLFFYSVNKRYECAEKMGVSMGTVISMKLYGDDGAKHTGKLTALINALDNKLSWRNEDSVVSKLNKGETVSDTTLASIILSAQQVSDDTEGAFDITVGELVKLWSIGEEGERVPSDEEITSALEDVDYEGISVTGNEVTYSGDGSIDMGAVGKGAACDMVKSYLEASGLKGAVVSVGGSILAWGEYNKAGDDWRVAVRHPRDENELLGVLSVSEGFISTSGDYERYFEKDGKRYHHILDGRTGYPADSGLISVTVVCDSGVLSDALSTACFILGYEKSLPLLEKYGASAVFVSEDMNTQIVGDISFEY